MMTMQACVVVLEDEPPLRDLICDVLAMEGYESVALGHPDQLVSLQAEPGLFPVDLTLPGKNGIDVARELREGRYREIPMIALSASGAKLVQAQDTGLFQDTIRKPFDIRQLIDRVERQFDKQP